MHIAFHIGAHCTQPDLLLGSLRRRSDALAARGVAVPAAAEYRRLLRDLAAERMGQPLPAEAQDALIETIAGGASADRLVLSNANFISHPAQAIVRGALYPQMDRAAWLRAIFADHDVSFHLCVRDPVGFVPALFRLQKLHDDPEALFGGTDARALRWSEPIAALLDACPDCRLTLWCYEDTPLVWDRIAAALAGLADADGLDCGLDMAREILDQEGLSQLEGDLAAAATDSAQERQAIIADHVGRFGIAEKLRERVPETWDLSQDAELTRLYEIDLARILRMDRVDAVGRG